VSGPAVTLTGIVKRYPGVVAVDSVDFSAREGEVHAIVGENGAGKTTLMRVLGGITRPDRGTIRIHGEETVFRTALDAGRAGIGMVHQHFTLVPVFTVLENIALGREEAGLDALRQRIVKSGESLTYRIDPDAKVEDLSVGERQQVEILRILVHGSRILILDEPTDVLTPREAADLYAMLRRLAGDGRTVLFISHRLPEVMAASDRITVMRKGRVVQTVDTADTNERELARLMVGRDVLGVEPSLREGTPGAARLRVRGLRADSDRGRRALDIAELAVRSREVVGIAGVTGNGQRELLETIFGIRRPTGGAVLIDERDLTATGVRERMAAGVAFVPEDRNDQGLVPTFTAAENLALGLTGDAEVNPGAFVRGGALRKRASEALAALHAVPADPDAPITSFSGGNQQKVVLARAHAMSPGVLLLGEPTRGLDVGAMELVHAKIRAARDGGAAVLLVSSDLDELQSLSDRILVLRRGRIVGEVTPGETTEEDLGLMMSGGER
jgi:simple sugar transport system ATP-binding protein